jgi:hypothetical protein
MIKFWVPEFIGSLNVMSNTRSVSVGVPTTATSTEGITRLGKASNASLMLVADRVVAKSAQVEYVSPDVTDVNESTIC